MYKEIKENKELKDERTYNGSCGLFKGETTELCVIVTRKRLRRNIDVDGCWSAGRGLAVMDGRDMPLPRVLQVQVKKKKNDVDGCWLQVNGARELEVRFFLLLLFF